MAGWHRVPSTIGGRPTIAALGALSVAVGWTVSRVQGPPTVSALIILVLIAGPGVGIHEADADRVFEVFESLHASDDHAGTGIGLTLRERIVERPDGEM